MLKEYHLIDEYLTFGRKFRTEYNENWKETNRRWLVERNRVNELIRSKAQPDEIVDVRTDLYGFVHSTAGERINHEATKVGDIAKIVWRPNSLADSVVDLKQWQDKITILVDAPPYNAKGDGVTDDTLAIQRALDDAHAAGGGTVQLSPSTTYLAGNILIYSSTRLIGHHTVHKHKEGSGFYNGHYDAMIRNGEMPTYWDPNDPNRGAVQGLSDDIVIEGITFDGQDHEVYNAHFICVDNLYMSKCKFINSRGWLDLRVVRDSHIYKCIGDRTGEDGFSVTDQNFNPNVIGQRGLSRNIVFEMCIGRRAGLDNTNSPPDGNCFEMDDGPEDITHIDCIAEDNRVSGFTFHVHTKDYDMRNIKYIRCIARRNKHNPGTRRSIAGFHVGMCAEGGYMGDILFEDCRSYDNESQAFTLYNGSGTGLKHNIKIKGGFYKSATLADVDKDGDVDNSNLLDRDGAVGNIKQAAIYLRRDFRNFRIEGARIEGPVNGYGIYTYGEYGELSIKDCTFSDMYAPLRLGHHGGYSRVDNCQITPGKPLSDKSTVCVFIFTDDWTFTNSDIKVDASQYTSHILRMTTVKKGTVDRVNIVNTGPKTNNAIQADSCGLISIDNTVPENFVNALFLSNESKSVLVNGCTLTYNTNVTNREDAPFLIMGANALPPDGGARWYNAVLKNGYQPDRTPRFMKLGSIVQINGSVKGGTPGQVIFTLPEGFRPSRTVPYVNYNLGTNAKTAAFVIYSNGDVQMVSSYTGINDQYIPLDCMFFAL